ncbi:hypothetical protein SAMN05216354_0642 [Xylanibacter ruminicola]|uniref:Uncharacterized protein n=1 Tax=Xylanibacter ruminicola TaxID=839 RepID=A0A1H5SGE9_XYLRU|nr:hypothetical protein SAMN05216354_0642 [Xylanibacter ruminicola]
MCYFHSIRLPVQPATSGGRLPPFCLHLRRALLAPFDDARVVQGERRAELARAMPSRSPHSQSISLMLCKGTSFFAKFQFSGIRNP